MEATTLQPKKVVRIIPPTVSTTETIKTAHTLVPRQSRGGIRFAFAALFVGAFCERPRANAVRPYGQTHNVRITEPSGATPCPQT